MKREMTPKQKEARRRNWNIFCLEGTRRTLLRIQAESYDHRMIKEFTSVIAALDNILEFLRKGDEK